MKRTIEEKNGFRSSMAQLKATPGWNLYVAEVTRLREATMASMYRSNGEDLAKIAGVLHVIDLCLNIENLT